MSDNRLTLGSFECVSLPKVGLVDILAKVDTGAYSGAIHCTDIRVVRRGALRKPVLCFTPAGKTGLATETDKFVRKYVRSATGHRLRRYLIQTEITLKGKTYQAEIGLSDRSDMKYQVLLGRRFLRDNNMLVDVGLNAQYDDKGDTIK
jgi:hypothetical protein